VHRVQDGKEARGDWNFWVIAVWCIQESNGEGGVGLLGLAYVVGLGKVLTSSDTVAQGLPMSTLIVHRTFVCRRMALQHGIDCWLDSLPVMGSIGW